MNKPNYTIITPFKRWTIQNFPFIEEDFDAITNYQLLCKIVEYLNKVIENEKLLEQTNNKLIDAFNNLKSYVDNYFDNLDVQDEINNKLDDMAESGQLTDIIAQYLGLAGVLAYDTIADMSDAENITNGSICYCLGDEEYNDGKGGFYKIRTVTVDDTVDGYYIVALDVSNTLIAERMPNYYINSLRNSVNSINNTLNLMNNKNMIIIGDSYSHHEFEDITKFWYETFAENLGFTINTNLRVKASDGAGFYNDAFYNRLYELRNMTNADQVTDIWVVGGLNDRSKTESDLLEKMEDFNDLVNEYFTNAKVTLVYVGNTNPKIFANYDNRAGVIQSIIYYQRNASKLGWKFLKNTQYILHNYDPDYWEDDGAHPSQLGQDELAIYLTEAYLNNIANYEKFTDSYYATATYSGVATSISNAHFISGTSNETSYIKKAGEDVLYFGLDSTAINCNGTKEYELATLSNGYFMGTGSISGTTVPILISGTIGGVANTRVLGSAQIYFQYGKMYINPLVYYNNSAVNVALDYIYIYPFYLTCASYYA